MSDTAPKFAWIDPAATPAAPLRVRGWFDTGFAEYVLPPAAELIALDADAWDARMDTPFSDGTRLVIAPPEPPAPPPTTIPAGEFLDRFSDAEKLAIYAACTANPALGVGLTMGLARGWIDLRGPVLAQWMAGLVAAGAVNDVRRTIIMSP